MLPGWRELKWATSNPASHFRGRSTLPPHLTPTPPPGVLSSGIPLPLGLLSTLRHGAGGRRWILRASSPCLQSHLLFPSVKSTEGLSVRDPAPEGLSPCWHQLPPWAPLSHPASAPSLILAGPSTWDPTPFLLEPGSIHSDSFSGPLMGIGDPPPSNPGLVSPRPLGGRGVGCRSETWDKASN